MSNISEMDCRKIRHEHIELVNKRLLVMEAGIDKKLGTVWFKWTMGIIISVISFMFIKIDYIESETSKSLTDIRVDIAVVGEKIDALTKALDKLELIN